MARVLLARVRVFCLAKARFAYDAATLSHCSNTSSDLLSTAAFFATSVSVSFSVPSEDPSFAYCNVGAAVLRVNSAFPSL